MDPETAAQRLFVGVIGPLVLGGEVAPVHAIGARVACAMGARRPADVSLAARVASARVRRARTLVPVDAVADFAPDDWKLAAAWHDLLHATNPGFCTPFRRGAAERILESAVAILDRTPNPATVREALSRHSWMARILDVHRTDTEVSWWSETRRFLGREPPVRLRAWPSLRRVSVVRTRRAVLDLDPIAVERGAWTSAFASLLTRSPLTDLETCTRAAPAFAWTEATLALMAVPAGRRLGLRALERNSAPEVDAVLRRATRALSADGPASSVDPALSILRDRALARGIVEDEAQVGTNHAFQAVGGHDP
jgi:hypothetical protein